MSVKLPRERLCRGDVNITAAACASPERAPREGSRGRSRGGRKGVDSARVCPGTDSESVPRGGEPRVRPRGEPCRECSAPRDGSSK